MNKEILQEILQTESVSFSSEEIQQMLDEELEKSPEEMDTQLIDLCIDVLNMQNAPDKKETKKHKNIGVKKILLIAAIIGIVAALAIPVGADIPAIESQGGIVNVLENFIRVNLTGGKEYNLSVEFSTYGIPHELIPCKFYKEECIITDVGPAGDNAYRFGFELTDLDTDGYIAVGYVPDEFEFGYKYADIYAEVEQLKKMTVNGIDMLIYSTVDGDVDVNYFVDNFSFSICFRDLTVNEATEIIRNF